MMSARLEFVVEHDGRLNLLCCLLDAGPLSTRQIAARIGESAQTVRYWIRLLGAFDLVEERGELEGGDPLYVAALDAGPNWVGDAVRRHRPRSI